MAGPRPPLVELMLPAAARIVGDDSIKSTLEINKPKFSILVASGWIVILNSPAVIGRGVLREKAGEAAVVGVSGRPERSGRMLMMEMMMVRPVEMAVADWLLLLLLLLLMVVIGWSRVTAVVGAGTG